MSTAFLQQLETIFRNNLSGISPLKRYIREKAWERFCALGLPTKAMAGYQYFPHSQFGQEKYELTTAPEISKEKILPFVLPESRRSYIVIANGQFMPEYSDLTALPEGVAVMPLGEALAKHGSYLQMRFARDFREEKDPLAILNISLSQNGLFIHVPPHTVLASPLQCLYLNSHERPAVFSPRIHFFLGKHAHVKWIYTTHYLRDFPFFSNSVLDVALEEGAHFEHYGCNKDVPQGFCFDAIRTTQKQNSTFKSLTCVSPAKSIRQDFCISLLGENASADLKGISLLTGSKQSHVNVLMNHEAPHTQSNQLFKNILADTSRASFEGKIYVHSKAQKTAAYQLNKNLLLNDGCIANSKPNLEIFADDVKASHGATVTQLKNDELFYLTARGIHNDVAKKLLLLGFCKEILQEIHVSSLREQMITMAEKCLS